MSYQLISERTRRAAHRHQCIWCGEGIPMGQKYVAEFSKFEGDVQRHAWHPECRDASRAYFDEGEDEFSPFDNERPATAEVLEYESWDCALLLQSRLPMMSAESGNDIPL